MTKAQERIAVFIFGVVFVIALLILAVAVREPTPLQYQVFNVVLALAAAGVAAMLPGFIEANLPKWARAGGSLAVFLLVLQKGPASLVVPPPPEPLKHRHSARRIQLLRPERLSVRVQGHRGLERRAGRHSGGKATEKRDNRFLPALRRRRLQTSRLGQERVGRYSGNDGCEPGRGERMPTGGYQHHWFQPKKGGIYCVRSRDGKHYAVIRVDTVDNDRIGFDFIFQPSGSAKF